MLQVALKETAEALGRIVVNMRETGLAITAAEEAHDDAKAKELGEKFGKMQTDLTSLGQRKQRLEATLDAERQAAEASRLYTGQATTVVNAGGLGGSPSDALAAGGGATGTGGKEKLSKAQIKEIHQEAFLGYVRAQDGYSAHSVVRERLAALGASEMHGALLSTQGNLGGFLVPEDVRAEIVKNLAGFTAVRMAGARVIPTSLQVLVYPSITPGTDPRSSGVTGAWRAEGSQGTDGTIPALQTQPTFGQERIPVHVWQPAAIVLTRELLDDSIIPLDSIIAELLAETKGFDEDSAFIVGTGIGQPRGILDYVGAASGPSISAINSGAATAIQYNGLLDTMFALKAQWRQGAGWLMASATFGEILKLKDSSNQPMIYQQSMPDTLFGKKVYFSEFMPQGAGGGVFTNATYPVVIGDFRYYVIAERNDMRIQRLEERFAPNVALLATARLGGGVIRTAAFKAMKVSA